MFMKAMCACVCEHLFPSPSPAVIAYCFPCDSELILVMFDLVLEETDRGIRSYIFFVVQILIETR